MFDQYQFAALLSQFTKAELEAMLPEVQRISEGAAPTVPTVAQLSAQ